VVSQKLKERNQSARDPENEHQRLIAYRAYQQWLANKQSREKEAARQKLVQKEWAALQEEQKKQDMARAQLSYTAWKKRKGLEMKLTRVSRCEEKRSIGELVQVSSTPSLPGGYCSVWACDEPLADHVLLKVPREPKTTIAD